MIFPAISIRQPWAEMIIAHGKDVENRTWKIPAKFLNRTVLIHAGKTWDVFGELRLRDFLNAGEPSPIRLGGIVGAFILYGNSQISPSRWAEKNCIHWLIKRAWRVKFHPCPGRQGFFEIDYPYEVMQ